MLLQQFSQQCGKQDHIPPEQFLAFFADAMTVKRILEIADQTLPELYLQSYIEFLPFFSLNIWALYQQAVGEVGIAPDIVLSMTPLELQTAYQGYLARKEMETDLMIYALQQYNSPSLKTLKLETPDIYGASNEYMLGSLEERDQVFMNGGAYATTDIN